MLCICICIYIYIYIYHLYIYIQLYMCVYIYIYGLTALTRSYIYNIYIYISWGGNMDFTYLEFIYIYVYSDKTNTGSNVVASVFYGRDYCKYFSCTCKFVFWNIYWSLIRLKQTLKWNTFSSKLFWARLLSCWIKYGGRILICDGLKRIFYTFFF